MKLAGILCWYDESPTWLATSIAGMARFCDAIVAVDGAYALYPEGKPRSHPHEAETIVQTAEALGVELLLHRPSEVWWGNEVEKRAKSLELAGTLEPDWVLVFDADFHVMHCEPVGLRHDLEQTDLHVASYLQYDGKDFQTTPELEVLAARNWIDTHWATKSSDVFRWHPSLRIGPTHYHYSVQIEGKRRWLKGGSPLEPDLNLGASLVVYHRTKDRALVRQEAAASYYRTRDELEVEKVGEDNLR